MGMGMGLCCCGGVELSDCVECELPKILYVTYDLTLTTSGFGACTESIPTSGSFPIYWKADWDLVNGIKESQLSTSGYPTYFDYWQAWSGFDSQCWGWSGDPQAAYGNRYVSTVWTCRVFCIDNPSFPAVSYNKRIRFIPVLVTQLGNTGDCDFSPGDDVETNTTDGIWFSYVGAGSDISLCNRPYYVSTPTAIDNPVSQNSVSHTVVLKDCWPKRNASTIQYSLTYEGTVDITE